MVLNHLFGIWREMKNKKDIKVIPKGMYCYDEHGTCPYWKKIKNKHSQECGYCEYLGVGDWERNEKLNEEAEWKDSKGNTVEVEEYLPLSLLWDMCKECGVNDYTDEELEQMMKEQDGSYD